MAAHPREIYDDAIVIDGLTICNWESDAVFRQFRAGNFHGNKRHRVHVAELHRDHGSSHGLDGGGFRERDDILQVKSTSDIHIRQSSMGKTGVILGFQNASPIENELDRLGLFLALGVRVIQLTYHETNLLGSGCWERNDAGLSNFGVDAVRMR